jgi:hypothetical protein
MEKIKKIIGMIEDRKIFGCLVCGNSVEVIE